MEFRFIAFASAVAFIVTLTVYEAGYRDTDWNRRDAQIAALTARLDSLQHQLTELRPQVVTPELEDLENRLRLQYRGASIHRIRYSRPPGFWVELENGEIYRVRVSLSGEACWATPGGVEVR